MIIDETPAARQLRILLVEDDPASALLLAAELEDVSCDDIVLSRADRLSSALERLAAEGADCVLLDLSLPDAQGIGGVVRLAERFPGMPVVVLTGTADEGVGLEAVAAGAEDFLTKGRTDGRGVARAVRYAVERRRAAGLAVAKEELERRIAERDRAERALHESRRMLEIAQEVAQMGSWHLELGEASRLEWTGQTRRIFGLENEDVDGGLRSFLALVHPEDRAAVRREGKAALREGRSLTIEHRIVRPDGAVRWVYEQAEVVVDERGGAKRLVGVCRDVTERREAELALRESEARFRLLAEHASDMICSIDPAGVITYASPAAETLFGFRPDELVGTWVWDGVHELDVDSVRSAHEATFEEGKVVTAQYRRRDRASGWIWVESTARAIRDPATDRVTEVQASWRDIGERKRLEGQLRYLADHDALTGLANRRRFESELDAHLARARRYGARGALLLLDLDNFKDVNDTLGHGTGDELIRATAEALRERLRETDVIARLGGDEFAVLLPEAGEREATEVAAALLAAVNGRAARARGGQRIHATTSIGVRLFDDDVRLSSEELLADADLAMYEAKESGRNRFSLYTPASEYEARSRARLQSLGRVRRALEEGLFELASQPIVDLRTGAVSQHELLIRMREGDGLVLPEHFLSVAERFGLIQAIDRWVIAEAVRLLARAPEGEVPCVEINLSCDSLSDDQLPAYIERVLSEGGIDPERIIFEVTETAAIANMAEAQVFVQRVRELGCRFALDDFGAGFGSFYYLKHLPFDYLKIDGEFIRNLPVSATDRLIVEAVVATARGMGKRTIAEFVGDASTVELLRELGVDYAQGYHLGRPGPAGDMVAALAA